MNILFLVVAVVVGGGFFIFYIFNTPRAKAARVLRKEEREAGKKQEARRVANFKKQKFVVYVRTKDGRKNSFESVLIGALLRFGVTVEPLQEVNGRAVADGNVTSLNDTLAIIGISWYDSYSCGTGCDYRLLSAKTGILGAGEYGPHHDEVSLAKIIVEDLAINFPEKNES